MAGGMTMVGDMFNTALQTRVSGLATDLAALLASPDLFAPHTTTPTAPASPASSSWAPSSFPSPAPFPSSFPSSTGDGWWPGDLGRPSASGSQNGARYAVFPAVQRDDGPVSVYDTGDHRVGGVQQQQGGRPGTLSFTSQHGTFTVDSLSPAAPTPLVTPGPTAPSEPAASPEPTLASEPAAAGADAEAILATLDRLGELHQRGVLTDAEFAAKKAELLARL